jgi:AAA domain
MAAAPGVAAPGTGRAQRLHTARVARYATAAQLSAEERLVAYAQARRAPRLPGELAARRLGVDADLMAAQLRERGQDAHQQAARSGLRVDQAAAVWHVLRSARTVEVVTGPAGTGKTRVLAAAARAWGGPVFGTATSQNATNELRNAGVRVAANTTRLLLYRARRSRCRTYGQ